MPVFSRFFQITKQPRTLQQEAFNPGLFRDFFWTQPGCGFLAVLRSFDLILYGFAFPASSHNLSIRAMFQRRVLPGTPSPRLKKTKLLEH